MTLPCHRAVLQDGWESVAPGHDRYFSWDLPFVFTPRSCPVSGSGLCLWSHKQTRMLFCFHVRPIAVRLPGIGMEVYNFAGSSGLWLVGQLSWMKAGAIWTCALQFKIHARYKMCCKLSAPAQGFSAVLAKCGQSNTVWMRALESCFAEKLLLPLGSVFCLKKKPHLMYLCLVWCQ